MTNWLGVPDDDPYGIDNLPYAAAVASDGRGFVASRLGPFVVDLGGVAAQLDPGLADVLSGATLDGLLAAGPDQWRRLRESVREWLRNPGFRAAVEPCLHSLAELDFQLAFTVADYVDFYASENHAANVGRIFRPDGEPLTPNWKHLPIGYHGRSGTVVVSGTDVRRPPGQTRSADGTIAFGPSQRLDIEAEVGFVVGVGSTLGEPVSTTELADHVFGLGLLNDWSARDIQAWEYVPLGPFLGKSFATSLSAWITPLAALANAWTQPPSRDPQPLPYLDDSATPSGLDLSLAVAINGTVISRPPFASMYWTPAQMLAHITANGASLRTGDLFASGTVSGPNDGEAGSLLELSHAGRTPIRLDDGSLRTFLQDGDEVVITATAPGPRYPIAIAEVRGRITVHHGVDAAVPKGGR